MAMVGADVSRAGASASLGLLSGFELRVDGGRAALPVQPQRVLAFLALKGRRQGRAAVAERLWMDTTSERAFANLRTALWRIHRVAGAVVECTRSAIRLDERVRVDLDEMVENARNLMRPSRSIVPPDWLADSFRSDLLPDWDEEWVLLERERVRQVRLHALEGLCVRLTSLGRYAEAIEAGQMAVCAEPLRESAHIALIQAHLAEGNLAEARRQFHYCRDVLRAELGAEPCDRLRSLVA